VITCARGRPALEQVAARTDVIECGDDDVDLGRGLDALGERGFLRVLTEGGPHLLGSLVDAGRLDELVTSLSPAVVGGDAGRMVAGAAASLRSFELTGVLEDEGTLFLHHRARRHERP
jgi:riboflavin biosynthesis pyrimidine reductase